MSPENYWKTTQEILQSENDPIVKRPRLTEDLLRRPPFRFIHDIVSAVQSKTGFAPGLFTDIEQNARVLAADKEAKIKYLKKLIRMVSVVDGHPVGVNPANILAGLDAEQTNILLQILGRVAKTGEYAEVVAQVLQEEQLDSNEKPERVRPPSRPSSERNSTLQQPVFVESEINAMETGGWYDILRLSVDNSEEDRSLKHDGPSDEFHLLSSLPLHQETISNEVQTQLIHADFEPEIFEQTLPQTEPTSTTPLHSENEVLRPDSSRLLRPQSSRKAPPGRPQTTQLVHGVERRKEPVESLEVCNEVVDCGLLRSAPDDSNEIFEVEAAVHSVCQLLTPLGRCIEQLHNASESFTQEQQSWTAEIERHLSSLADEEKPDGSPCELQTRVQELEEEIERSRREIRSLKLTVSRNQERIKETLESLIA